MNYKNLSLDMLNKISMVLGREVISAEAGNTHSFTEFSNADVEDFRALEKKSGILAVSYIRFRLSGNVELDSVVSYYATVVQKGISVDEWSAPR